MLLPAGRLHDGGDRGTLGAPQQTEDLLLLGIRTWPVLPSFLRRGGLRRALGAGCRSRLLSAFGLGHFRTPLIGGDGIVCCHHRSPAEAERRWRGGGPYCGFAEPTMSDWLLPPPALRNVVALLLISF